MKPAFQQHSEQVCLALVPSQKVRFFLDESEYLEQPALILYAIFCLIIYTQTSSLRSFHLLPVCTILFHVLHKDIRGNLTEGVKGFPYVYSLPECYGVRNSIHMKENKFLFKTINRC